MYFCHYIRILVIINFIYSFLYDFFVWYNTWWWWVNDACMRLIAHTCNCCAPKSQQISRSRFYLLAKDNFLRLSLTQGKNIAICCRFFIDWIAHFFYDLGFVNMPIFRCDQARNFAFIYKNCLFSCLIEKREETRIFLFFLNWLILIYLQQSNGEHTILSTELCSSHNNNKKKPIQSNEIKYYYVVDV